MRIFDESQLSEALETLAVPLRVAFAAACAERQMVAYRRFEHRRGRSAPGLLERALDEVWADPAQARDSAALQTRIEEMMALVPDEDSVDDPWTEEATRAQFAAMAVMYALRAKVEGDSRESAYAARVAYDALDDFVIGSERIDINLAQAEEYVLSHPLVRAELTRQWRDIEDLKASSPAELGAVIATLHARAVADAPGFFGE